MAARTIEGRLAEVRRQIDDLDERADSSAVQARARLQTRVEGLREQEAGAWAAVREKAEAVDEQFRQLEIDIAIAESRLVSELAEEATVFAEAVEAELGDWDAAIERLQTRAATQPRHARERAETAIAELRQTRNRVTERLAALRTAPTQTWPEHRTQVMAALDALERKVRETAHNTH